MKVCGGGYVKGRICGWCAKEKVSRGEDVWRREYMVV